MDSQQPKRSSSAFEYFLYAAMIAETGLAAVIYKVILASSEMVAFRVYFAIFYFAFLAWTIEECHPSATICFGVIFSKTQARIEENVYIGSRCQLGKVHVQRDVLIASGTHITSGSKMHGIDDPNVPIREQEGVFEKVTIGAGSWIGSLAVVMADVGKNCVIGAGAVVTKSIPDQCVAGGVPAKVIRERV